MVDEGDGPTVARRRRALHLMTFAALATILGLAVLDGVDVLDVYGVDEGVVRTQAGTARLSVDYPAVVRPALASPFAIRVDSTEGFTEPITIAVSRPWIASWDENGLYPTPSSETGDADWVIWEFEPPDGNVFVLSYDGRIEPALQSGRDGAVELRDGTEILGRVDFHTRVMP